MSSKLEIEGTVSVIRPIETFMNDFTKRVFVLELGSDKYPKPVPFELKKDKCSLVDTVAINSKLKVGFYLDGREWANPTTGEVKYYPSLSAVDVEVLEAAPGGEPVQDGPKDADIPF